jgi:hypothetical protein
MKLGKDDDSFSAEVVYLVDREIRHGNIASKSIPVLELEKDDCGSDCIEGCAHFYFDIPQDIFTKKYKIVIDMVFYEAEWIFINPVRISK